MNISPSDERDPAKMMALLAKMSAGEQDRFEHYRRSRFARPAISALVKSSGTGDAAPPTEHSAVVVATLAKMYVGDLVRTARAERARRGIDAETPLTPTEYETAARILSRAEERPVGDHKRPRLNGPPVFSSDELL